ncbi:ribonucleotide reductase inhibitor-domain-containing protein [Xylariaceae sp. FL0594]|nr:ribonucleotide reductase inhibitor-domain-containing protein [Xylariaceae sp. FL0594]
MSAPRTKRPFVGAASDPTQRQITSFFSSQLTSSISSSSSLASTQHSDNHFASNNSNLPAAVQANLLSVGMRVRKSVPEGYKTGSYSSGSKLWGETNGGGFGSSSSPAPATDINAYMTMMGEGQRSRANAFSSPRELLPFCGIHKVGGMDTQPEDNNNSMDMDMQHHPFPSSSATAYHPTFGMDDDHDEEMPGLTSTQDTIESSSSSSSPAPSRKRTFVADDDEGEVRDISSKRLSIWCRDQKMSSPHRALAAPRRGRLQRDTTVVVAPTSASATAHDCDVKIVGNDFEEAEFLEDRESWEVDMRDV